MNPLSLLWRREITVFHIRLGGCGGCGEMVDRLLRDGRGGTTALECSSPRHAGLIVVSGIWTGELGELALDVIDQAPKVRRLLVVGDCAAGRGPVADASRTAVRVSDYLLPDLEVEGCPVMLESLVEGVKRVAP